MTTETLQNFTKLGIPSLHQKITDFCERWQIAEFAFFGSILRADFGPDSDVDVLVVFDSGTRHGLFELVEMEEELQEVLGRKVDILTRRGVEHSSNPQRRKEILQNAEVFHVRRAG